MIVCCYSLWFLVLLIWCAWTVYRTLCFLAVWLSCWIWWDILWLWCTTKSPRILLAAKPLEALHQRNSQFTIILPPTLGQLWCLLCWPTCWQWCYIKNEWKDIFRSFTCTSVLHTAAENHVGPSVIHPWHLSRRTLPSHIPLHVELPQGTWEEKMGTMLKLIVKLLTA